MGICVIPYRYSTLEGREWQPEGVSGYFVAVSGSVTVYFDAPVAWLSVADEVQDLPALVTEYTLHGEGMLMLAIGGLQPVKVHEERCDVDLDGLCYLNAVSSQDRYAAFQKLGRYPTVSALQESGYAVRPVVVESYGHTLHMEYDNAGQNVADLVASQVAVVGGLQPSHLEQEYSLLKTAMADPDNRVVDMLLYLNRSSFIWDAVKPDKSRIMSVPVQDDSSQRHGIATMTVQAHGTTAVMLSSGTRLSCNGVVYGCDPIRVFAVFREPVQLEFLPKLGRYKIGDPPVYVTILTSIDTDLDARFREWIDPKASFSRFLRETSSNVMRSTGWGLHRPRYSSLRIVHVSDPLDRWRKLDVHRYGSNNAYPGTVYQLPIVEVAALHDFRCDPPHECYLRVLGVAVLREGSSAVVVRGRCHVAIVGDVKRIRWSIRLSSVYDQYNLDNGGPSDTDFSDAI